MRRVHALPTTGMTMVEVTAVLVIMTLLMTMAVPSLGSFVARHRLRAAAEHLATDLGEARHEAAKRRQTMHLAIASGSHWCYAIATAASAACDGSDSRALRSVRGSEHPGITVIEASPFSFDPATGASLANKAQLNGAAAVHGHAVLASSRGDVVQVRISQLGRPAVCAMDAPVGNLPRC